MLVPAFLPVNLREAKIKKNRLCQFGSKAQIHEFNDKKA
jgi:hypothetical protein